MTVVQGRRLPDPSRESVETAVADLFADVTVPVDGEVLVLVDAPYPYHPSTGYVTHPQTLRAVLGVFAGHEVAVATAGAEGVDPGRTARFVGYERVVEDAGADLLALEDAERVEVVAEDGRAAWTVPAPLHERSVVVVPTVRRSAEWGVEAGCWTLAAAMGEVTDTDALVAAPAICEPVVTLVDAVHVYGDPPASPRLLLASEDVRATTAAVADLLDVAASVPHLDRETVRGLSIEGVDSAPIESLLAGTAPWTAGDDRLLSAGYRLYARLTGDLVPPQLLGGDG